MRLSEAVTAYFIMAAVMFGSGVVPFDQAGLVNVFMEDDDGAIGANESAVINGGDASGMLDNLIGPVRNALGTIAGGSLLAVWGAIDRLAGFVFWPVTVTRYIGAPREVVLLSGVMAVSFTFGVLRVFRGSV